MTDTSSQRQQAIDALLPLIDKFASENLPQEIAGGDSQAMTGDAPKHLQALHEQRDTYHWRLVRQQNSWYPREPIGLTAYAADHHSKPAQMFCNALLLVADRDGSGQDYMDYRWFHSPGEAWYRGLNDPWHTALLAEIAALHANAHEMEREFWAGPNTKGAWIEAKDDSDV